MKSLTIILDVDEVLADFATPAHAAAERILGRSLTKPEHWMYYDIGDAMHLSKEEHEFFHERLIEENNLGYKIDLFPGAVDFVDNLRMRDHDVYFATAPWPGIESWTFARQNLLSHYFHDMDVIFTATKHRLQGDFLIDDKPATIRQMGPRGVLFDRPWNREMTSVQRVHCYETALSFIDRKAAE